MNYRRRRPTTTQYDNRFCSPSATRHSHSEPTPLLPDSLVKFATISTGDAVDNGSTGPGAPSSYAMIGELGLLLEALMHSPFEHTLWVNGSKPTMPCGPFVEDGKGVGARVGSRTRNETALGGRGAGAEAGGAVFGILEFNASAMRRGSSVTLGTNLVTRSVEGGGGGSGGGDWVDASTPYVLVPAMHRLLVDELVSKAIHSLSLSLHTPRARTS